MTTTYEVTASEFGNGPGWPHMAGTDTGRAVVTTGPALDAITMPAEFGALVLAELRIAMLAGPVIADRHHGLLTFLTEPRNTGRQTVPPDLLPFGVCLLPAGAQVAMPAGAAGDGQLSWFEQPAPARSLSIWSVVVGAARRVAARCAAESWKPKVSPLTTSPLTTSPLTTSPLRPVPATRSAARVQRVRSSSVPRVAA